MNTWWNKNQNRWYYLAIKHALHPENMKYDEVDEFRTLQIRRRRYLRNRFK